MDTGSEGGAREGVCRSEEGDSVFMGCGPICWYFAMILTAPNRRTPTWCSYFAALGVRLGCPERTKAP